MAPLLPVALALTAGILLYGAVSSLWWICVPVISAAAVLNFRHTYYAILFLSVATGFVAAALRTPPGVLDSLVGNASRYSGTVTEHREYEGAQMIIVHVDSCDGRRMHGFMAKCLIPAMLPPVDERDRIVFNTTFSRLQSNRDLPDETDYNSVLRRMGVTAEAIIVPDSIASVSPEPGVMNDIRRMRRPLQRTIATMPVSDGTKSFLLATLTGDRAWLTPSARTLFSATGIAHILALSGLHVGVITALLLILFLPFSGIRGGRHVRLIITVAALWIFAILTGLSPSVVRAVIMATMFAVCTMLQRVWSPLNALSAAAIIILLFTPTAVYSLGFILTFSAVLSIIIFADALNPVDRMHRNVRNAVGYLCVTVAAVLGTGIVCAYMFHIFPVYFLLTNIAVTLILPPLLGFGVIGVALNAIGIKVAWLGHLLDWLYSLIDSTAEAISTLPRAMISDIWMPGWTLPVYYIMLAIFALYVYRRRVAMLYALTMILAGAIIIGVITVPAYVDSEVYITRSHTETTMLVKEGKCLYSYTTARAGAIDDIRLRDETRYRGYMIRRSIPGIMPLTDGMRDGSTSRRGNVIVTGSKSYVFIYHDSQLRDCPVRPDYAVICRGFRGDITRAAQLIVPDSILLSSDLNLRRHDRYVRELTAASIPHRSLRPAPYHRVNP